MGYDSNNNDAFIDSNDDSCTFDYEKEDKQKLIIEDDLFINMARAFFKV